MGKYIGNDHWEDAPHFTFGLDHHFPWKDGKDMVMYLNLGFLIKALQQVLPGRAFFIYIILIINNKDC